MKQNISTQLKRQFRKFALSGLMALSSLGAFAQVSKEIGSVNSFKQLLSNNAIRNSARVASSNLLLEGPSQTYQARINSAYNNAGYETYAGKILNHGWADFHVQFKDGKASGLIVLFDEKKAFEFTTNAAGVVVIKDKNFDRTISVDNFGKAPAAKSPSTANAGTPGTTADGAVIPLLQSNASASTVVYLDFDGEYVVNTPWNSGVAIDAEKPNGSAENITAIWQMVAEDWAPFNLNVTTSRAVYDATPAGRRQMIIFTPNDAAAPGSGGVAFIGGFSWQPDLPCWVFIPPSDFANSAEAASHEAGHTFGLVHDGRDFPDGTHEEYYNGHANWGPIVGVAYGKTVSQFSKGEYQYASNQEDDLVIISSSTNGFGFRTDDHGSTGATATQLTIANDMFSAAGLISTRTDKDYFKFSFSGGKASINVNKKYDVNTNLNVLAQILNSNLQVVAESNPTDDVTARFTDVLLAAGVYYLVIDGVGEGDATTGYTDYGSLGEYVINASFTTGGSSCSEPEWIAATAYNGNVKVSYNGNIYVSKWWTQNNQPDLNTGEGKPWTLVGPCGPSNKQPVIAFTAPAKNSVFNQGATVTLVADAIDPDGTISKVEFLNSSDVVVFTDNVAPYEYSLTNLPVGLYIYKAKAYDNTNLASSVVTNNFEIKAVSIPPIISISSSLQGQVFYEYPSDGRKIDVALTQQNPSQAPIDSVKYIVVDIVCNGPGCAYVRRYTVTTAPFGINIDPFYSSFATANSPATEIYAIAFSKGVASEQKVINVKVKPLPELTIVSPVNNVNVSKNIASLPIDVTVNSSLIAIDSVVYDVYDTKITGTIGVTTTRKFVKTTPYDFELPVVGGITFTKIFALAYGDGGKFSRSQVVQVNYNEVPTVYITDPASTFRYNAGGSVTIKATVGDVDGTIAKVEIYSPHIPNSKITLTAPPYQATFNNLPGSGVRGATSFVVVATDNQGGVNGASIDIVENSSPVVTITSPIPVNGINPKYVVGGSMTVSANVSDSDGSISKVEFTRGGTTTGMVTLTAAPFTATFTNLPAPSPDGSYWFNVKAYDNNGGVTDKVVIVYRNRVPSVMITAPTNNATYPVGSNIAITTLVYDPDMTSGKVEFFKGATKIGESTVSPYSFTINNATAGAYAITAKVTDDMGESATSTIVNVSVANNTCSVPAWNSTTAYSTGNRVSKNGTVYEAKWWSQNNDPITNSGTYDVWKVIGACNARLSAQSSSSAVAYPNPFTDALVFEAPVNAASALVSIVDLNGTVVLSNNVAAANGIINTTFETSSLQSGIYIIQIVTDNDVITYKVSK
jgi:chitodextrinase